MKIDLFHFVKKRRITMKMTKKMPLLLASLFLFTGLTACGGSNDNQNVLNIVCISAGYDRVWIDKIAEKFQTDHPGITVDIRADRNSESIIQQNLSKKKNTDDLYISVGAVWKSYAAQGYFADLSDFIEEEVDGVKVKDKIADEYAESIYYTRSNGEVKCYRLPFTSGIGGIFYNKKMFDENGWVVPTTYTELIALCEQINAAKLAVAGTDDVAVKPFTYAGTDSDYFDYTVFDWWAQIAGKNAIKEFLKYESVDNFDVTKNATYAALKTATEKWYQLFKSDSTYYVPNNNTTTAENAQKQFINGYAAMMFNGDWLYNESLNYTDSGTFQNFELGLMKTPVLDEANENYVHTSYVIGEDQYIAIPASSSKKELAKSFIKAIISDQGCETFIKEAHGFLAYKADYSKMSIENSYMNGIIALRDQYTDKFTNFSSNRKYLCNYLDIWCSSDCRPFEPILKKSISSVDIAFNNILRKAQSNWDRWTAQSN